MAITKPPVLPVWGESNTTSADMVQPTNPQIQAGWPNNVTPPARQRFNWLFNLCTNAIRYFSRRGMVDYDAGETYMTNDIVRGDDNKLTRSLTDNNINHTPSTSAAQWGAPLVYLLAQDDNTDGAASTKWTLNQLATATALMDGVGAVGTSKRFARADHVHPSDSSKANTSGSYPNLSVGFATSASTASRARPLRIDGVSWDLTWSGQGGQPNWLVGSNDGVNFYVWNPANFSVNYATLAGSASTAGYAATAGSAANATSAGVAVTQAPGTSNTAIATTQFACPGYSHGTSGYDVRPSGLIDQWGYVYIGNPPTGSGWYIDIAFPIPFPNACYEIQVTPQDEAYVNNVFPTVNSKSASGFRMGYAEWSNGTQNVTLFYSAKGK